MNTKHLLCPQPSGWRACMCCGVCSLRLLPAPSVEVPNAFTVRCPFSCPVTLALPRILCGACTAALLPFVPAFLLVVVCS